MDKSANDINKIAELKNTELENEFQEKEMISSLKFIRYMILLSTTCYFSLAIYDFIYGHGYSVFFLRSIVSRSIILVAGIIFFCLSSKMTNYKKITLSTSFILSALFFSYMYVLLQQNSQSFSEQAFSIMAIMIITYSIPNRWINMLSLTLFFGIVFLLVAHFTIINLSPHAYIEMTLFFIVMISYSAITSYRIHYYKRKQYLKERYLKTLSFTDKLTDVYNRLKFDEVIEEYFLHANKHTATFSIVMYDIDNFKEVNDGFGHLTGDQILIETANIVKQNIRTDDIFARWGGEEFVILLPNTSLVHATELSERIRVCFNGHEFFKVGQVTASFGVTEFHPGDNPTSITNRVDLLLYSAKQAGKNLVVSG